MILYDDVSSCCALLMPFVTCMNQCYCTLKTDMILYDDVVLIILLVLSHVQYCTVKTDTILCNFGVTDMNLAQC